MIAASAVVSLLIASACFTPEDQSAGWKKIPIPADMPSLAAPDEVEQLRGGEPGFVWYEDWTAYAGATDLHRGKRAHDFRLPKGTRRVAVHFTKDLRGTKVDATVSGGGRSVPLLNEKRIGGTRVDLDWTWPDLHHLRVVTHHHLRRPPVVGTFWYARLVDVSSMTDAPEGFREPGILYYLHPGGRRMSLCDRPGRPLSVRVQSLSGVPTAVDRPGNG